jgi:hypothetical protein
MEMMMEAKWWSSAQFLEKKRKQNARVEGKGIAREFCFPGQDTIECVIGFRIDSRTIKRPLGELTPCIRPSEDAKNPLKISVKILTLLR